MTSGASIFGGSYWNDDNAGSRYANVDNWPENSNDNWGGRGRSDPATSALVRMSRQPRVSASSHRGSLHAGEARTTHTRLGSDHGPAGRPQHRRPRRCTIKVGGQPDCPASAKTFHGPAERGVAGRMARHPICRDPGPALFTYAFSSPTRSIMAKRYRNLIGRITAGDTMREAYRLTSRGKRLSPGYLDFKEFDALNLGALSLDMASGTYREGAPHQFHVYDPKLRLISALPFRDRVAQQALCLVLAPIFDRLLLPRTFACRIGKGTHAGVKQLQADLRHLERSGPVYFLKTDFSRYFASIERATLWRMIDAKVSCSATRRLLETMIPRGGIGLPIGSLTSQIFANVYAGALDRHLQQDLGEGYWYRYMDDLVVLGRDPAHLRALKADIEAFSRDQLGLRFSKWSVAPASRGINFLGYRVWSTHKLLRRDSVVRARRKIARYRAEGDAERLGRFLGAWLGHASHADSRNLIRSLGLHLDTVGDNAAAGLEEASVRSADDGATATA